MMMTVVRRRSFGADIGQDRAVVDQSGASVMFFARGARAHEDAYPQKSNQDKDYECQCHEGILVSSMR